MPLVIGLAGTIAAGKSTVAQLLVERGAHHCDADKLVHRLYDPGTPGFARVVEAFGEEIIGPDGSIDRKVLGAKVFGKPEEMNRLTRAIGSITEAVKGVIDGWRAELGDDAICVMEAVNLMEPGYARWCDQTWLIGVDDAIARRRLIETRGMSEEEANQRLASMVPLEVRAPGADWVYRNNGTLEELREAVYGELDRLLTKRAAGEPLESRFPAWWAAFLERNRERLKATGVTIPEQAAGS
ncbi:dephospho-CoA kinase [Tepidiforma thermophila]|uniref:Dephospho-CoA kinase n=1 Tax=Tepidiforma thermophila (strain KCTC 52669 / CGMCC 1.13589 / G233) TaxID=2761530 RepID=A0A2A9HI88_TEPT2|nr:dephospho-CoA kinase [Tepidiforma thermophila]PFG75093.1 dephospho-CoA kinase [Tepidiforma thermophila]